MLTRLETYYQTQIAPYLQDRVLVICVVILLLGLLLAFGALRRRSRGIRVFKTTSGRVEVTRSAIRDLVLNACHYVQTPRKPKVSIKARRGRLYIHIGLKLNEDQRLNDIAVQLQTRIEDVLQNTLNLDRRSVRIDIGLKGIRHARTPAHVEETPPGPVAPVPDYSPVKVEEEHFISTEDEPEEEATETEVAPEKPKRGFFGFGRRGHSEPEPAESGDDDDATETGVEDPFAPGHRREDEEKRV